jgi:hypothetical protein
MPPCRVTFVLPFDDSDDEDGHNRDFENSPEPDEEVELDLDEEILPFQDDDPDPDSELEEGTSFIDIEEYLAEMALIEPPELPSVKIQDILSKPAILGAKSRGYYNDRIRIQALMLLQQKMLVWQIAQITRMDDSII